MADIKKTYEEAYKMAQNAGAKFPSIVAAQFGLESAWGTATAGAKNNLFNLKWDEGAAKKMRAKGLKVTKSPIAVLDKATGSTDYYMQFESEEDSFKGYLTFLEVNPRYAKALKAKTPEEYIRELKKAGYAEDKKYVSKILTIAKDNKNIAYIKKSKNTIRNEKERKKIFEKYQERKLKIINKNTLSEANRDKELSDLNREYYNKGFIYNNEKGEASGLINEEISKTFDKKKDKLKEFEEEKTLGGKAYGLLSKIQGKENFGDVGDYDITEIGATKKDLSYGPNSRGINISDNNLFAKNSYLKELQKELPKGTITKSKGQGWRINRKGLSDLAYLANKEYEGITGEYLYFPTGQVDDKTGITEADIKGKEANFDFINNQKNKSKINVNSNWDNEIEIIEFVPEETTTDPTTAKDKSAESVDYFSDQFYNLETSIEETPTYDAANYKNNFPYVEVAGSLAGAVTGLIQAGKDTPRRDEEISGAFMSYTQELKRLSEIGLQPEEEAYAKQMLSESYQTGIESIVRASGGNRNVVLANLGRLDAQQQRGLVNIALKDAEIKNEALYKYGEAMKYVSEFDANKDIANKNMDYQEALLNKEAGAELAAAGFTRFLDEMAYYRENAPGSAMSIAKSIYFQDNLGYDPNMKDNGKGDTKGTKSNKDRIDAENLAIRDKNKYASDLWNNMTPDKKKLVDKFNKDIGFGSKSDDFLEWMNAQSVVPENDINYKKLESTTKNNFSALFEESQSFTKVQAEFKKAQNPLQGTFESSFEKEKNQKIEKNLNEFNPFENPFETKIAPFEEQSLFDSEPWKNNNYINKQ